MRSFTTLLCTGGESGQMVERSPRVREVRRSIPGISKLLFYVRRGQTTLESIIEMCQILVILA